MSAISDIIAQLPIDQLASQLGASEADTATAVTHAVQSLLGGMSANVADGGEAALTTALADHAPGKTKSAKTAAAATVDVKAVDQTDGKKIVSHVLGTSPDEAAAAVSDKTGTDPNLLSKLLPILAPMVMTYLASKVTDGSAGKTAVASGVGNLLGGLLGQKLGSGNSASSSGGLANLLGKLF